MKLAELVTKTKDQTATAECIAHFLCLTPTNVYLLPEIPPKLCKRVIKIIRQHQKGIPLAYLLNNCWFYNRRFYVDEKVLVPRHDTEVTVAAAEKQIKADMTENRKTEYHILDLCAGSGIIGISLGYYCREIANEIAGTQYTIVLADKSRGALAVSAVNAGIHGMQVNLSQSDLFERLQMQFDLIVCNPPYIPTADIGADDKFVLREPQIALDGGADGLDFYRRILSNAKAHLKANGTLILEIGSNQGERVTRIAEQNGFSSVRIEKDLAARDRVVIIKQ
jgi:release factor glutamine methyltransferase